MSHATIFWARPRRTSFGKVEQEVVLDVILVAAEGDVEPNTCRCEEKELSASAQNRQEKRRQWMARPTNDEVAEKDENVANAQVAGVILGVALISKDAETAVVDEKAQA